MKPLASAHVAPGAGGTASAPVRSGLEQIEKGNFMRNKSILLKTAALFVMASAVPATAAPILFELSGSRSATFTIDPEATAPDFFSSSFIGDQVSYNNVAGTFGGVNGTAFVGFGTFLAATLNVQSPDLGFTQFTGPELFTTVNARPVFRLGTFQLNSIVSGASTIRISAVAASVPEPMSWALMTVGFGMAGVGMRYRRRSTRAAASLA